MCLTPLPGQSENVGYVSRERTFMPLAELKVFPDFLVATNRVPCEESLHCTDADCSITPLQKLILSLLWVGGYHRML